MNRRKFIQALGSAALFLSLTFNGRPHATEIIRPQEHVQVQYMPWNDLESCQRAKAHYRAFMSLVRHFSEWEQLRQEYGEIEVPVLLIYGDHDWSRPREHEANLRAISRTTASLAVINEAGHLLSLDQPDEVIRQILSFGT